MKNTKRIVKNTALIIVLLVANKLVAQPVAPKPKDENKVRIQIGGGNGIELSTGEKDIIGDAQKKRKGKSTTSSLVFDFGFVNHIVEANYVNPKGANYMDLRTNKSINFNITQLYGFSLIKKNLYLVTGAGMNFNNYRYTNNLNYAPAIIGDSVFTNYNTQLLATTSLKKSKVATNYITVPLMLQAKIGQGKKKFVLGGGVSGGYLVRGWQKAVYSSNKDKQNISYAFNPFALNAIGEIGIDNRIRFYGSYGLTNIHKAPLKYNPITFGLRINGL